MAKPKRSHGGKGANPLNVRWKGRFALSGPKEQESHLRDQLQAEIEDLLNKCPRFAKTSLPGRYAFRLAYTAEYKISKTEQARIIDMTVTYRNKKERKDWVIVEDGEIEFVATGEGRPSK